MDMVKLNLIGPWPSKKNETIDAQNLKELDTGSLKYKDIV